MKHFLLATAALLLAAGAAVAQPAPTTTTTDLTAVTMNAYKAMLELREAELKRAQELSAKREAEWTEYSKPLWEGKEPKPVEPAEKAKPSH